MKRKSNDVEAEKIAVEKLLSRAYKEQLRTKEVRRGMDTLLGICVLLWLVVGIHFYGDVQFWNLWWYVLGVIALVGALLGVLR